MNQSYYISSPLRFLIACKFQSIFDENEKNPPKKLVDFFFFDNHKADKLHSKFVQLESAIYQACHGNAFMYATKCQQLLLNLYKNKQNIISIIGEDFNLLPILSDQLLAYGTAEENKRIAIAEQTYQFRENMKKINLYDNIDKSAPAVICRHCGSSDVYYYSKQTRGADEPATVFFMCLNKNCGKRWRQ